jgi:succinate dehydrogenase / fumarate reductase cytochrome b subunit
MPTAIAKPRREFRNIHVTQIVGYRLPIPGVVSILHRISGALLFFFGLPVLLWLFQQSLSSEISFEAYRAFVAHPLAKLVLLAFIWAYAHHLIAGIRHLVMDLHYGLEKHSTKQSATVVMVLSLAVTAALGLKLFGVY